MTSETETKQPADQSDRQSQTGPVHCRRSSSLTTSVEDSNDKSLEMTKRAHVAKSHRKWNRRLKVFFCCLGYKKNKDSIADVASIFAEFYADLKVPSSEMAAGFVLLSKYQAAQRQWIVKNNQLGVEQYLSSVPITAHTHFLDISTAEDSHLINELIYYMNYGLATFGWPLSFFDDPFMLCCIFPYLRFPFCQSKKRDVCDDQNTKNKPDEALKPAMKSDQQIKTNTTSGPIDSNTITIERSRSEPGKLDKDVDFPIVLADNCCGCNVASVERRLAAHNYEIIYVSYKVDVNVVPFLVAADHSKQTVVVAMRGSMSLSDMVTDMNGQIDKLPIEDCPDDWLCHRGITRAACYVKETLIQENILARAFNCRPDLGSENYNLVLCGHSLGAGVAAILGILLRKPYPTLRAYIYSPPGGILSLPAVQYTKEFATGIILGNDCVPRLGVAQLERLRYQVLLSLKSSQKSTSKILAKALCPSCCFGDNKVDYDPSQSLNILHGTGGRSFDYNGSKIPFQVQPQVLYVPGRLVHIVKNQNFKPRPRRLFNEPIFQAVWTENTMYDRVMISEGMFYDHLPNNLLHAMKMLFSKTLPARKDSKSPSYVSPELNIETAPEIGLTDRDLSRLSPSNKLNEEIVIKDINSNEQQEDHDENNNGDIITNHNLLNRNLPTIPSKTSLFTQINDSQRKEFDKNGNDESLTSKNPHY